MNECVIADFFCLRNKRNRRKKSTSLSRRAALVAQNSPNRLCKHGGFGSDITPALRLGINLPSANFDFLFSYISLTECFANFRILHYRSSYNIIYFILSCVHPAIFWPSCLLRDNQLSLHSLIAFLFLLRTCRTRLFPNVLSSGSFRQRLLNSCYET